MQVDATFRSPRPVSRAFVLLLASSLIAAAAPSAGAATLGHIDTFSGTSLDNWGGQAVMTNPGTGGFPDEADGFLSLKTPNGFQRNLGARTSEPAFTGSWTAAGIKQVRLWLRDIGTDDPLEMHVSVGQFANLWQYNVTFLPPTDHWAEFVVDASSSANWTRIIGTGTFADALANVEVFHVRHDKSPYVQNPDPIDGDVGIDQVLLTDGLVGVPRTSVVPRALELAPPAPNPSRGDVTLSLESFEAGAVRVEILDAGGRLVRRFAEDDGERGVRTWTWDGRDAAGHVVAPGWYRVRATGPSGGVSRTLVRIE